MTPQDLIDFENRIKQLWEAGDLPYLVHLSGGNEHQLCDIFQGIMPGDWVLSGHRSHYHYLLSGGDPDRLEQLIRDGRSMFVFDGKVNFLSSSILAGMCCIGAGLAWAIKERNGRERVWCFLGDGAEEQGHFYEAAMFVEAHDLPCRFIIEDNNRSVDTDKASRRGRVKTLDQLFSCVQRYSYTPTYPHAGSGCRHHIVFKTAARP